MQKIKLSVDETAEYMDIIRTDDKLSRLFNTLSELYGSPEWLSEIKPMQDPQTILGEWKEIVREYAADDVINAARRLFRFGKIKTFPMPAHILAELADVEKITKTANRRQTETYHKPAELVHIWRKAIVFAVVCGCYRSTNQEINDEGDAIRAKLPIDLTIFLNSRVWRAIKKYLSDDPRFCDIYRDDDIAQFVACYNAGVFADIIADIKQNINAKAENFTADAW